MAEELKIPYLLQQNYFTEDELRLIWCELDLLNRPGVFESPEVTGSARNDLGEIKKVNSGLFIHEIYRHPKFSAIQLATRKLFAGYTYEYSLLEYHTQAILQTTGNSTLVSYYENSDHYKPHRDQSVATALHWLWKEPKKFEGGELTFTETGETIPLTNNTMILFPAYAEHAVSPVVMAPEDCGKGLGRYCLSLFLFNEAKKDENLYS